MPFFLFGLKQYLTKDFTSYYSLWVYLYICTEFDEQL